MTEKPQQGELAP